LIRDGDDVLLSRLTVYVQVWYTLNVRKNETGVSVYDFNVQFIVNVWYNTYLKATKNETGVTALLSQYVQVVYFTVHKSQQKE
jgi:hypothetical protein